MDFTDTGINRPDSPISDEDNDLRQRNHSSFLRLRSQIFEASYRKTDLIRANRELSYERDALRRRNRELEAGIYEAEMIRKEMMRDLEVYRERVCGLEVETKEKSTLLTKTVELVGSVEDRLSKLIRCLNEEDVSEGGRGGKMETEECNSKSILELVKEVETKLETFMETMEKKKMELSRSVEFLEEENRDINVLLRAALSEKQTAEKQLKEMNEQKGSALLQIAGRGLQRIGFGFGFGFGETAQESSETGNLVKDEDEEEDNGVVIAIENTMKNLRQEISQLKISLDDTRLEEEQLKKLTEEQTQKIAVDTIYIDKLHNREKFLAQNVEELVKAIRETESEVSRWREVCELEVEAGQREVELRDHLIEVLKAEVKKLRSALVISDGKLKLKEDLAKAAMAAEEATERSLRLSERRIAELLSRIEHLYRQLEEAESTERRGRKFRYVCCWPLWRLPTGTAAYATATGSSSLLRYDA
ncbi:PREDICTED: uncharacterized protein At3g49055-like [Camelina sativa]|uniref:Uncharacterized protein At3g49055-like n=1 Tax=Camelina sativa TaxID=90675 RepID=A0ABM0TTJ6_CAMSA|nr:PREDICTED: uncharacterized protein At3g49055-like [Camelina sativa]